MLTLKCASAAPSSNEDRDAQARELFAQGQGYYAAGDFPEALRAFLDAYALKPLPLLLYNAAQTARRSGKYEQALDLYRQYLLAEPHAPERVVCERYIAELVAYTTAHDHPVAPSAAPEPKLVEPNGTDALVASPPAPRRRTGLIVGLSVGAVVVVGTALALGLAFGLHASAPSTMLGTYQPYK
jgi:tetratricopeptide (TPR) repeat protein